MGRRKSLQDEEIVHRERRLGGEHRHRQRRPDGEKPHGHDTYFDYLREQVRLSRKDGQNFTLSEEQCQEADREFLQHYHRRMCWLALRQYDRAVRDADHTLAFMDLVNRHAPNQEYQEAHEQYRGFVLFQRTQAAAALEVENNAPEQAVREIHRGLDKLREFFTQHDRDGEFDEDGMVRHLRQVESALREQFEIGLTLEEQLQKAIAEEDYERAAQLRDALKRNERS